MSLELDDLLPNVNGDDEALVLEPDDFAPKGKEGVPVFPKVAGAPNVNGDLEAVLVVNIVDFWPSAFVDDSFVLLLFLVVVDGAPNEKPVVSVAEEVPPKANGDLEVALKLTFDVDDDDDPEENGDASDLTDNVSPKVKGDLVLEGNDIGLEADEVDLVTPKVLLGVERVDNPKGPFVSVSLVSPRLILQEFSCPSFNSPQSAMTTGCKGTWVF